MPFTPFHFGPGALLKAAFPRHVSLLAFGTTQVAIDLESWHYLTGGEWPVHREWHSIGLATTVGLAVGTLTWGLGRLAPIAQRALPRTAAHGVRAPAIDGELTATGALIGGLLGGATHTLLDALMHRDLVPFAPWLSGNPLLGRVDLLLLHLLCLVAGVVGALWLLGRRSNWSRTTGT